MHDTPRRTRRGLPFRSGVATLAASLLLTGLATVTAAGPASAEEVSIDSGTVTWGVRTSWRNYAGPGNLSGGLTANPAGEFVWQVESGEYDSETKRLELQTSGSVHWDLHDGALDVTLSDLLLVVDGNEPQIFVDVQSKDMDSGAMLDYGVVALADLDLAGGEVASADGTTSWSGIDAALSEIGVQVFAGFYGRGSVLDTVSASYDGPGEMPELPSDNFTAPSSLGYSPGATSTDVLANAVDVLPDVDRDIVHVVNETSIRPYDATTLAPLGAATTPSFFNGWTSYPAPVLHHGTGAIVGNLGGNVVAQQWDDGTGAYVNTLIQTGTAQGFSYDALRDRVYLVNATGISYVASSEGAWSTVSYAWAAGTAPSLGRPALAIDAGNRVVVVEASMKPQLVTLAGATATPADLPGDYSNPVAQQAMYNQPTEVHAVGGGGFRLTNYMGQIYTATRVSAGVYTRAPGVLDLELNQLLRSSYDAAADIWYLADWGAARIVAVHGTNVGELTVKALGYSVLHTIPVAGDAGRLYAVASRQGENAEDYGLRTWTQEGLSPSVTTQPAIAEVDLTTWTGSAERTLVAAGTGDPAPSVRWQTRAPGVTSLAGWTDVEGATSDRLTVALTEPDEGRQYRAIYTNGVGSLATEVVTAVVNVPPAILVQPSDADVTEAADATFEVMPKGHPYPAIVWQRRVGGYWQSIDPDDDNFAVDGGTLVVRDTNTEQTGSLFRARLRNHIATIYTRAVRLDVAAASDEPRTVAAGELAWGVKESFRTYVSGPIAHGTISTAGGASTAEDGTFRFPLESGTWDPGARRLDLDYGGSVHFSGHGGQLELDVADVRVRVTGDTGVLVADVSSKTLETGTTEVYDDVELAALDAAGALSVGSDSLVLREVGAALTAAGSPAFGGFYAAGAELDDLGATATLGGVITRAPVASRTAVTVPARTTYGRPVAATVRVTAGSAATGAVRVTVAGRSRIGTLVGGAATVALPRGLKPGRHPVSVSYAGSGTVAASTGHAVLTVTKAAVKVRGTLPRKRVPAGTRAALVVSARVVGAPAVHPTGTVTVRDGRRVVARLALRTGHDGKVRVRLPRLAKGVHRLRVVLAAGPTTKAGRATPVRLVVR